MSSYSEGQTHQLMEALQKAQFTSADVTTLGQFSDLPAFKGVIRGLAKIVVVKHVVDCDANPFLPKGWKGIEYHKKGGMLEWNLTKACLHLSPNQQSGKIIKGHKLRKELENEPVLNANVLDYLLAHPELIPEEWKGKRIFFWGTIYRGSDGDLYVRYLYWRGSQWHWDYYWLGDDWSDSNPSACSQVSSKLVLCS